MAKTYGKFKRSYGRGPKLPPAPAQVTFRMPGRADIDQASYWLQTFIAELQSREIDGIEGLSVTITPLKGGSLACIAGEDGKPAENLDLHLPAALRFAKAVNF